MRDGGLHCELGGDVEHATTDTDGDLGTDDLRRRATDDAVANHEPNAHKVDGGTGGYVVFEMLGVFDDEGDANRGDSGCEGEGLRDVTSGGDAVVLHDLKVGVEVWLNGRVENG